MTRDKVRILEDYLGQLSSFFDITNIFSKIHKVRKHMGGSEEAGPGDKDLIHGGLIQGWISSGVYLTLSRAQPIYPPLYNIYVHVSEIEKTLF